MLSVKPWRPETVFQYCAAVLFCICVGVLSSAGLQQLHIRGFRQADDFGNLLLGTLTFQGVACGLTFVFWRHHNVAWRDGFGLNDPRLKQALLLALLTFLVVLPVVWLLQAAAVSTLTRLGYPPDDQTAVQLLDHARSWWVRGYLAGFAVVLAPVAEEFIFRGLLYPLVKQLGWPRLGFVGVSLLFALIHFDVATFLPLFVLALALTWLYERTDNLLAPITAHALFNATNLGLLALNHLHLLSQTP